MLTVYFDTTTWIRPFEDNSNERPSQERNAINIILEEIGSNEIISSKFQLDQLYSKVNSKDNSEDEQDAFAKSIALCLQNTGNTTKTTPYCKQEVDELIFNTKLKHREDAYHIAIAWLRIADYFITTDGELYDEKKSIIEKTLNGMWNWGVDSHTHNMTIINPIDFLPILRENNEV